jgi:FkbM family methyltransferase
VNAIEWLSDNVQDALCFGPAFAMRHFSHHVIKADHPVTIAGARVVLRRGSRDAVVFRSIFRDGDWNFEKFPQAQRVMAAYHLLLAEGKVPVIIDAGANVGAASLWFAAQFPRAKIIAVEPDPDNAAACRQNTMDCETIHVVEAAIGSTSGQVALCNPASSSVAVQTTRSPGGPVPILTVAQLCGEDQLFILKADIEGFEADLFSANTGWVEDAAMIMVETHDWMMPGRFTSRNMQNVMAQHPFEVLLSGENLIYVR